MEKLKSVIPETLKRAISESTTDDLPSTCSSLLDFFQHLPLFHQIVRDLTDMETALCRKNRDVALEWKRKGNDCFSSGDYPAALRFYSQALRVAPTDVDEMGKDLVATLYVNRAAVTHKMGLPLECLQDSSRALAICPSYGKAWYRRGKANASLGNYEDAYCDLNLARNMELSLGGKKQIERELNIIKDQPKGKSSSFEEATEKLLEFSGSSLTDDLHQIKLKCVSTPTKGRGMVPLTDVPQASLIHTEEPYAAIILKHCRDTHCHFCLNELPVDTVPCSSCLIPLYCSQQCQVEAGGRKMGNHLDNNGLGVHVSDDLKKYSRDVIMASVSGPEIECIAPHKHECQGVHWPAVLPSEVVLAGRVLVRSMEQQRHFSSVSSLIEDLDLCHNYVQLPLDTKVEMHIHSIILLQCLQHPCGFQLPINGAYISQCVILLAQIKVNCMAIVRMKSSDVNKPVDQSGVSSSAGVSSVEQVRVGQAIYSAGSLFNHSCRPNIHAYFLSRTLFVRSTELVVAGYPLELSYGPQLGQMDCKVRQKLLEDQYSFRCQCAGCSELNFSDLVLNAFRCVKPNCFGVVLDSFIAMYEKQKVNPFRNLQTACSSEPQVNMLEIGDIKRVAHCLFEQTGCTNEFKPGYCLSCGSFCNLETFGATVEKAEMYITRLEDAIVSKEVPNYTLSNALRSLDLLRSTLHAYNKRIAEVEDSMAQMFCLGGELQPTRDHCKASIEIIEKLYGLNHVVVGNELVKLASVQLSLGDPAAVDSINRVETICSRYYGSHTNIVFPHLRSLKRETCKLVH